MPSPTRRVPTRPANDLDVPALRDRLSAILGRPVRQTDYICQSVHDAIDRLLDELVEPSELESLADWHDTKAEKARRFPGPLEVNVDVMKGKALVHDDAARRLRELAARGVHEDTD